MGKINSLKKRPKSKFVDPALDQLTVIDARSMLITNLISMGWRLAIMVLLPIFIGIQIDKKLNSSPSVTLAAFFIALFGAGILIYRTYVELTPQSTSTESSKQNVGSKEKDV